MGKKDIYKAMLIGFICQSSSSLYISNRYDIAEKLKYEIPSGNNNSTVVNICCLNKTLIFSIKKL